MKINESGGQFYQLVEWQLPKTCDVREEACASINLPIALQDAKISKIKVHPLDFLKTLQVLKIKLLKYNSSSERELVV